MVNSVPIDANILEERRGHIDAPHHIALNRPLAFPLQDVQASWVETANFVLGYGINEAYIVQCNVVVLNRNKKCPPLPLLLCGKPAPEKVIEARPYLWSTYKSGKTA